MKFFKIFVFMIMSLLFSYGNARDQNYKQDNVNQFSSIQTFEKSSKVENSEDLKKLELGIKNLYGEDYFSQPDHIGEQRAFQYFKDLEIHNNQIAFIHIGHMYQYGKAGLPVDTAKANLYYAKGFPEVWRQAQIGFAPAQYTLGLLYFYGDWVSQNYMQSIKWFRKAARQGYVNAKHELFRKWEKEW